ncbi:MAG: hypothetical protein JNL60_14905 [Bacteroidia bacterium]|nr:hypothetical protein [Bacteroidia bacterium]
MRRFVFVFCFLFFVIDSHAQYKTGEELVAVMHKRYYKAPCKIYSFSQRNTHYKADTVSGHSEWHEVIEFPDKFRIDFGNKSDGNFVVFKNDSVFNYKAGKQVKLRADSNTLLLLLGGMYYRPLEDVFARVKIQGYDLNILSSQVWNGEEVFVIGAKENDLSRNQFWVNKKTLRVLRIIEARGENDKMDMRFEAHQDWCKGYVETKVSFRRNGKLEQVEEYYDIKEATSFPER